MNHEVKPARLARFWDNSCSVAAKTLDLDVVCAGVKEAEYGRRLLVPATLAVKMVNISYFRNIKPRSSGTLIELNSLQNKRLSASAIFQSAGCRHLPGR